MYIVIPVALDDSGGAEVCVLVPSETVMRIYVYIYIYIRIYIYIYKL